MQIFSQFNDRQLEYKNLHRQYLGFKEALKWVPIMPRDVSLLDSRYYFFSALGFFAVGQFAVKKNPSFGYIRLS